MGGVNHSKLVDSDIVTGLSFMEEGDFSKLYKGYITATKKPVTIKVPKVPDYIRKEKKAVKIQIEEAKKLLNTNIRKPIGDRVVRVLNIGYDDFRKEIWIIKDYVDGTDLESIMKNPSLCPSLASPEERMRVAVGIAQGMSYLHNLRSPVVHGDLKPTDVILTAKEKIPKISDFGLWDFKNFFMEETGQPLVYFNPYQAPEVVLGEDRPTLCSDIWSLGCVLLQWMLERPPWDIQDLCTRYSYRLNKQDMALSDAMEKKEPPSILSALTDESINGLADVFLYQPMHRPKASDIESVLISASSKPTWTRMAYHKYYNNKSEPLQSR